MELRSSQVLPSDHEHAALVGRVWLPAVQGPAVVAIRAGKLIDLSARFPLLSELLEADDPAGAVRQTSGVEIASLDTVLTQSLQAGSDLSQVHFLAPCDLQAIKASGVTFVNSLLERVVEEQAKGNPDAAGDIRRALVEAIGADLAQVRPGSDLAAALKTELQKRGYWSQYLEVGIGPDAEVFTKCQPLAAVGIGADVGIHPNSSWNNPEPEVVLAVNSRGDIAGATLGNDVNLRDFEGRSALLLGRAKDNNSSCAIGPFIRLFDQQFTLDTIRQAELRMTVRGNDGFVLEGHSSMRQISRDPVDLVGQTLNEHHSYPDGVMLFLGTMFAPTQDRFAPGKGFTHAVGDEVEIATPSLGTLINRVTWTHQVPRWHFGARMLMRNLRERGLL
jgi:fumarylacetoacetate (FAA) hydrolase family protein